MFADGRNVQAEDNDGALPLMESGGRAMATVARVRHGMLYASVHRLLPGDPLHLQAREEMVSLLMPQSGDAAVNGVPAVERLSKGQVLLLGQPTPIELMWRDPASLLVIEIPRTAIQAEAFAQTGTPRRLGRTTLLLDCLESAMGLAQAAGALIAANAASGPAEATDKAIIFALVKELAARTDQDGYFPVAGSVQRALGQLAKAGGDPASLDDVTRAAGVVHATLRRAVKEVTGIPLSRHLQDARLDWFRARLHDDRESRSLRELAAAVDYHPAVCSRAYQRRFGETPTQTRAQAFTSLR